MARGHEVPSNLTDTTTTTTTTSSINLAEPVEEGSHTTATKRMLSPDVQLGVGLGIGLTMVVSLALIGAVLWTRTSSDRFTALQEDHIAMGHVEATAVP